MSAASWTSSDSTLGWKRFGSPEWTNSDLSTFIALATRGSSAREIAKAMGRSEQNVLAQAFR